MNMPIAKQQAALGNAAPNKFTRLPDLHGTAGGRPTGGSASGITPKKIFLI
jgi:hypothetical protein